MEMNAMVINRFGDTEIFEMQKLPIPTVTEGHVLIRVRTTSVNPLDTKLRRGLIPPLTPQFPAVLHGDVAGEVVKVGAKVKNFKIGDRVFGCAGGINPLGGALAEYMLADERLIAKLPDQISFEEGAAIALVGLTAWESVFDKIVINPGDSVMVLGGTGGVAHIAIQLARLKTSNVYSTASSEAKDLILQKLGTQKNFNYRDEKFLEQALSYTPNKQGFDVVIDTLGGASLDTAFQLSKRYGHVITCQSSETHDLSPVQGKALSLHLVLMLLPMITGERREHHQEILENLSFLMSKGLVRPLIHEKIYDLAGVGLAHKTLEAGKALGKIVVRIP
jgi:NADPH2:quinone reductase